MNKTASGLNKDLLWFYDCSDADCGISSSWNSLVSQSFHFHPSGNVAEDKMVALMDATKSPVKRLRRISKAFFSLPIETRRIIESTYSFYNFPAEIRAIYGHKSGCALFNSHLTTKESLLNLCRKKLNKKMTEEDEKLFFLIGEETRILFEAIHLDFVAALQRVTNNK